MAVNERDIRDMVRSTTDNALAGGSPIASLRLLRLARQLSFEQLNVEIGRLCYNLRADGKTMGWIAEGSGLDPITVKRWSERYAEQRGLPIPTRGHRVQPDPIVISAERTPVVR